MILLKPVFIIAIVAVAMIGVMVPSVFAQFTGMAEEPIATIRLRSYSTEREPHIANDTTIPV